MNTERIKHLLPIRVILRPKEGGGFEGYIENSFSMGWSDTRVNINWTGQAYDNLGGKPVIDGIKTADYLFKDMPKEYNAKIYDPLDSECPIQVDWDAWLSATRKYDVRNAPFQTKGLPPTTKEDDEMNRQEGVIKDSAVIARTAEVVKKVFAIKETP